MKIIVQQIAKALPVATNNKLLAIRIITLLVYSYI